jgi:uncharacterized protein (TIGR02646 family)
MRYINKAGGGGTAWDQFAATKGARYENAPKEAKDSLRRTLARQQGYLCAFCMSRLEFEEDAEGNIKRHKTKIAHLTSQSASEDADAADCARRQVLEIDQHNLVLACMGQSSPFSHCDDKQGNDDVSIPFENEDFMRANFIFLKNGLLGSKNEEIQEQIGIEREADDWASILNLNNPVLCRRRREALESLASVLQMRGDYSHATLTAALSRYTQPNPETGRMQAYCEWLAHYLSKRLERSEQQRNRPNQPLTGSQKKSIRRR